MSYFTKRCEENSFESRNKSFHSKNNPPKPKPPQKNYLISLENKENVPTNSNKTYFNYEETRKSQHIGKPYLHRRVETYCDLVQSIDDENSRENLKHGQISPFSFVKEEPKKLMNKSLIDCRVVLNERKKTNDMNSYENVGRLLKLLKQDAEKRINSRRKADMSFTTTTSFLKPPVNYKAGTKDKNIKRSISTGISRKGS